MTRLVTATLHSAVDRIIRIDRWEPGRDMRGPAVIEGMGGKGMCSAVTLRCLGQPVAGVVAVGGAPGHRVLEIAEGYGIDAVPVWVAGDTRESHVIVETETGEMSHVTCGALSFAEGDFEAFLTTLSENLVGASGFVAAGSLPPGIQSDAFARLAERAASRGVPAVVDCQGDGLRSVVVGTQAIAKCNDVEYGDAFGAVDFDAICADLPGRFAESACTAMVVTCGSRGLLIASDEGLICAKAPRQEAVSAAGAGDAASATIAWRFGEGDSWRDVARWAAAVSAASVLSLKTGEVDAQVAHKLLGHVDVTEM